MNQLAEPAGDAPHEAWDRYEQQAFHDLRVASNAPVAGDLAVRSLHYDRDMPNPYYGDQLQRPRPLADEYTD